MLNEVLLGRIAPLSFEESFKDTHNPTSQLVGEVCLQIFFGYDVFRCS